MSVGVRGDRRRRLRAAAGSIVFLGLAPGVVAGLVPWLLTSWEAHDPPWSGAGTRVLGVALIVLGSVALLHAFARFVLEGIGTPAPVAPTERLVVGGLYRHVRNPMYLAVGATIVGQALVLGRAVLLAYAMLFAALVAAFVRWYEEPALTRRYGERYEEYARAVPAWLPRLRPWKDEKAP